MAADLPDMRHESSMAMAKSLVTYMDDPVAIRRAIVAEFDNKATGLGTIKRLRAEHLKPKPEEPPFRPHEGYYPAEAAENARAASAEFLARIERERARSVELARAQGALHSPLLKSQYLVDSALEREVAKARKGCGF